MQFKQDDVAVCGLTDGLVKVKYGPYTSPGLGKGSYLVEWLEGVDKGMCSVVGAEDLEPAPRFRKGQEVLYRERAVELVSGPFPDADGDLFWVVKKGEVYDHAWEMNMMAMV